MQIISASRRCDMPAFNMQSIINKFHSPSYADCFWVLWTKNPQHIINSRLDFSRVALQLTVTGLGGTPVEPGVPPADCVWHDLKSLINKGFRRELVNWRMDPLLPSLHTPELIQAQALQAARAGITRCTTSFLSAYDSVKERWPDYEKYIASHSEQVEMVKMMREILDSFGITLYGCAQPHLVGLLTPSRCIDGDYYSSVTGFDFNNEKDEWQRKSCGCTQSKDVGSYRPCQHRCVYCYARPADAPEDSAQLSLGF